MLQLIAACVRLLLVAIIALSGAGWPALHGWHGSSMRATVRVLRCQYHLAGWLAVGSTLLTSILCLPLPPQCLPQRPGLQQHLPGIQE